MGLLEDINSGKNNLVILIIGIIFIFHIYWTRQNKEHMANLDDTQKNEVKNLIYETYKIDVEAIKNLSEVANKLQAGGLTHSGNMNIQGKLNIGSNANSKDFPEWLTASVEHTGDSHLRLKTKKDDNKNIYLINRDGDFKLKNHGGEVFSVDKNGQTSSVATGDNVHNFIGKGNNPYITISKDGEWSKKSWYLQNYNNDGNNKIFRIGVHDEGPKLDIHKNGNAFFTGEINTPANVLGKQNRARYIRVGNKESDLNSNKDNWSLIELRAYDQNGINVAAGKPVSIIEGSSYDNNYGPGNITNNKIRDLHDVTKDNMLLGYHGGRGHQVLQIDLGKEIDLSHIELFNRWNVEVDQRLDGTTVEFLGADGKRNRIIYTGLWHRQYSKEYVL